MEDDYLWFVFLDGVDNFDGPATVNFMPGWISSVRGVAVDSVDGDTVFKQVDAPLAVHPTEGFTFFTLPGPTLFVIVLAWEITNDHNALFEVAEGFHLGGVSMLV